MRYPLQQLEEEVAFVAYYLHWGHEQVMNMEHSDRRTWVHQVSSINQQLNAS